MPINNQKIKISPKKAGLIGKIIDPKNT